MREVHRQHHVHGVGDSRFKELDVVKETPQRHGGPRDVEVSPLAPRRLVDGEVVVPRVRETISLSLSVVAAVLAEVNGELEGAGLSGVDVHLRGGEGRLEADGAVWDPHVVRILGVVDGARLPVVEVVPVTLPSVSNTVGVGRDGNGGHHALVDVKRIKHGVFGVIHNAVGVLVSHQLQGSCERNRRIDVGQSVTDAPVVALTR